MSVESKVKSGILLLAFFPVLAMIAAWQQQNFPGGGGGSFTNGVFNISTSCSGTANCLQWVDDDSTDNCGAATTAFMALINAYAGPGSPQVIIGGSGSGKAYKLATASCHLEFDVQPNITLKATLDCAQPSGDNCIQFGATGLVAYSVYMRSIISGGGTITGCVNLTTGCIHVEPYVPDTLITNLNFKNVGAGNATQGSCTNYAVYFDSNDAEGTVSYNHWQMNDTTAGRCAFANLNGATAGTNTIYWIGNVLGGANLAGSVCSSQGIVDGGSYGMVRDNNIYGWGVPIRVQGYGHRIEGNTLDTSLCSAHGVHAHIQFGANGSAAAVGPITIANNQADFYTNGAVYLFAQAGDSTATISGVSIFGNQAGDYLISGGATNGAVAPSGLPHTPCSVNTSAATLCYNHDNPGLLSLQTTGLGTGGNAFVTNPGWIQNGLAATEVIGSLSANIGATTCVGSNPCILFTPITGNYRISCTIQIQTIGTTSTLPQCVINWTDAFTSVAQSMTITPVWASGTVGCSGTVTNTAGNSCTGSTGTIFPKTNTNVTVTTTGYASTGTAMTYYVGVRAMIDGN